MKICAANNHDQDEEPTIKGDDGGRGRLVRLLPLRVVVQAGEDDAEEQEVDDMPTLFAWLVSFFSSPSSAFSSIL